MPRAVGPRDAGAGRSLEPRPGCRLERAALLLRLAVERDLAEKIEHHPFAISSFHDEQGRVPQLG